MKPELRRGLLDDLAQLNQLKYEQAGDPEIQTRIAQYEMAYKMQTGQTSGRTGRQFHPVHACRVGPA